MRITHENAGDYNENNCLVPLLIDIRDALETLVDVAEAWRDTVGKPVVIVNHDDFVVPR